MSKKSDAFELEIANYNNFDNLISIRPNFDISYSDVLLIHDMKKYWLEVKSSHKDQLANPRFFYDHLWQSYSITPLTEYTLNQLNQSSETKTFINSLKFFFDLKEIKLSSSKDISKSSITTDQMKEFLKYRKNHYILDIANTDLGSLVSKHYLEGKKEPVFYMQVEDDFYMIGNSNPINLSTDIPVFCGYGPLRVRVSTRSKFYEIQTEIKIKNFIESPYSLKPGSKKMHPFKKGT